MMNDRAIVMTGCVNATIKEGHRVASGQAENSPYPAGSIKMQMPFFKKDGIDLESYYLATLNLSIVPYVYKMISPEHTVHNVQWARGFPAEDFSFSKCAVIFNGQSFNGLIYYPHPDTKIDHFQSDSLIEVITKYISNIEYGDKVELRFNSEAINISRA